MKHERFHGKSEPLLKPISHVSFFTLSYRLDDFMVCATKNMKTLTHSRLLC